MCIKCTALDLGFSYRDDGPVGHMVQLNKRLWCVPKAEQLNPLLCKRFTIWLKGGDWEKLKKLQITTATTGALPAAAAIDQGRNDRRGHGHAHGHALEPLLRGYPCVRSLKRSRVHRSLTYIATTNLLQCD